MQCKVHRDRQVRTREGRSVSDIGSDGGRKERAEKSGGIGGIRDCADAGGRGPRGGRNYADEMEIEPRENKPHLADRDGMFRFALKYMVIQGGWGGWPTGNGKKISSCARQHAWLLFTFFHWPSTPSITISTESALLADFLYEARAVGDFRPKTESQIRFPPQHSSIPPHLKAHLGPSFFWHSNPQCKKPFRNELP